MSTRQELGPEDLVMGRWYSHADPSFGFTGPKRYKGKHPLPTKAAQFHDDGDSGWAGPFHDATPEELSKIKLKPKELEVGDWVVYRGRVRCVESSAGPVVSFTNGAATGIRSSDRYRPAALSEIPAEQYPLTVDDLVRGEWYVWNETSRPNDWPMRWGPGFENGHEQTGAKTHIQYWGSNTFRKARPDEIPTPIAETATQEHAAQQKFKVGDRVRVCAEPKKAHLWVRLMNETCGRVYEIETGPDEEGDYRLKGAYWYRPEWLTKVEAEPAFKDWGSVMTSVNPAITGAEWFKYKYLSTPEKFFSGTDWARTDKPKTKEKETMRIPKTITAFALAYTGLELWKGADWIPGWFGFPEYIAGVSAIVAAKFMPSIPLPLPKIRVSVGKKA